MTKFDIVVVVVFVAAVVVVVAVVLHLFENFRNPASIFNLLSCNSSSRGSLFLLNKFQNEDNVNDNDDYNDK